MAVDPQQVIAEQAGKLVQDNMLIGLGTGRAATAFIHALGERVKHGLKVKGVPTSERSDELARQLGIPLTTLAEVSELDLNFDGADEVDPNGQLIKGLGGALVREKIVAATARRFIVLVGSEKKVKKLGERGTLPVEVVPFGLPLCQRRLQAMGLKPVPRQKDAKLFISDNGNPILDCQIKGIDDPHALERELLKVPGVVDTGLFLDMADTVLIGHDDGRVETWKRGEK
ncbi:MAG: ribose-5-phosphate isomerase RpiA [Gemmataceae bacterium]